MLQNHRFIPPAREFVFIVIFISAKRHAALKSIMKALRLNKRRGILCNPHLHTPYLEEKTFNVPLLEDPQEAENGSNLLQNEDGDRRCRAHDNILHRHTAPLCERHDVCFEISRIKSGFRPQPPSSPPPPPQPLIMHTHTALLW